jgi:hypothetical protein
MEFTDLKDLFNDRDLVIRHHQDCDMSYKGAAKVMLMVCRMGKKMYCNA